MAFHCSEDKNKICVGHYMCSQHMMSLPSKGFYFPASLTLGLVMYLVGGLYSLTLWNTKVIT